MSEEYIVIHGKNRLRGSINISGAKNSALPIIASTVLAEGRYELSNIPMVRDIEIMLEAIRELGLEVKRNANKVEIINRGLKKGHVVSDIVKKTRASILLLGPLVSKTGDVRVVQPGGCPLGRRDIGFHIEALSKMGAEIENGSEYIVAKANRMKEIEYEFPSKTVTGTENILMAASLINGKTVLKNCAIEPEIGDLIDMLTKMGVDIKGKDSDTLIINGKRELNSANHKIIHDRIELGTYLILASMDDNEIVVNAEGSDYVRSLLDILEDMGIYFVNYKGNLVLYQKENLKPINIETQPYPGFPTDLQAQIATLLTQIDGESGIRENIFDNRFAYADELNKMGAKIEKIDDYNIKIKGKTELKGNKIIGTDLRATASLVLAGLIAEGETIISNAYQLFRGYENMVGKLRNIGADIEVIRR